MRDRLACPAPVGISLHWLHRSALDLAWLRQNPLAEIQNRLPIESPGLLQAIPETGQNSADVCRVQALEAFSLDCERSRILRDDGRQHAAQSLQRRLAENVVRRPPRLEESHNFLDGHRFDVFLRPGARRPHPSAFRVHRLDMIRLAVVPDKRSVPLLPILGQILRPNPG